MFIVSRVKIIQASIFVNHEHLLFVAFHQVAFSGDGFEFCGVVANTIKNGSGTVDLCAVEIPAGIEL